MAVLRAASREYIINSLIINSFRCYSEAVIKSLGKKQKSKETSTLRETDLAVETNAETLVNYVCGTNLMAEGGENVKIKADSEYPDWLWTLHTGPPKMLCDMDPNTLEYWWEVRRLGIITKKTLHSLRSDKRDYK